MDWSKTRMRYISAGVFTLLVSVLGFEIIARVALSNERIFSLIKGRDATSARVGWVLRHGDKRKFVYKFDVYHPRRGWALKPRLQNLDVFETKVLNSNSRGLRGTREYDYNKPQGKQRILIFGDSYTFGDEVSDNETYSHFLDIQLPNVEVLNFGVHGYGHDQMLLYLKDEGVKYRPDIVILGFVWFNMYRNLFDFIDFAKPTFVLRSSGIQLTNVPIPSPEHVFANEPYHPKSLDVLLMIWERIRWAIGVNDRRAKKLTAEILDDFVSAVEEVGAVPIVVYLPVLIEILDSRPKVSENESFLNDYCKSRKLRCLFLRKQFLVEKQRGINFNTRSHWFVNGHRTAANAIREYLVSNELID